MPVPCCNYPLPSLAWFSPWRPFLTSSCRLPPSPLHFTHTGFLCVLPTSGPLHFAVAPNPECSFPSPSRGWLFLIHLASAQLPPPRRGPPALSIFYVTEINKYQRFVSCVLRIASRFCVLPFVTQHCLLDIFPHRHMWICVWWLSPHSIVTLLGPLLPHLCSGIILTRVTETQWQDSLSEMAFSGMWIVLLPVKYALCYLWMRPLWHLATDLIKHRCGLDSMWSKDAGGQALGACLDFLRWQNGLADSASARWTWEPPFLACGSRVGLRAGSSIWVPPRILCFHLGSAVRPYPNCFVFFNFPWMFLFPWIFFKWWINEILALLIPPAVIMNMQRVIIPATIYWTLTLCWTLPFISLISQNPHNKSNK